MTKKIEFTKYIRDGQVAVLVSHGYGAGWSTWAHDDDVRDGLIFDGVLVQYVLDGDLAAAAHYASDKYNAYTGGSDGLTVEWVPQGEQFYITEYDGHESLRFKREFHTA